MKLEDARKLARSWRNATIKFAGTPTGRIGEIGDALIRLDVEIEAQDDATDELIGEVRRVCNAAKRNCDGSIDSLREKLKNWDDVFDRKAEEYDAARYGKA